MKRIVLCMLLSILLLPLSGKAETSDSTGFDLKALAEDTVFLVNINDPEHAVLGLERNANTKRYPASTTKIMTCIIALETCEPDENVSISSRACRLSEKNSKMGLKPGETFPMIDLLYGLMLPSGNDAAIAIAEHIGGSVNEFAGIMNKKAESLGMTGTHFTNPHGLHNSEHYTTARDLAVLTAYAMENETFREIVSAKEYKAKSAEGRELTLRTANRLLRDSSASSYKPYSCLYPNAIGVKTGDTHLAGKCLVAAAEKNGETYILVLLHGENAPSEAKGREKDRYAAQRFFDAIDLFEYAFEHDVVTLDVQDLIERCLPETYAVTPDPSRSFATQVLYRIEWDRTETLTLPRWQADAFALDPFPDEHLVYTVDTYSASVGDKAGNVEITMDGRPVFHGDLIVDEYTFPPTSEPTLEPIYTVADESPEAAAPVQSPEPEATPVWITVPETPEEKPGAWLLRLFRCTPSGQS